VSAVLLFAVLSFDPFRTMGQNDVADF